MQRLPYYAGHVLSARRTTLLIKQNGDAWFHFSCNASHNSANAKESKMEKISVETWILLYFLYFPCFSTINHLYARTKMMVKHFVIAFPLFLFSCVYIWHMKCTTENIVCLQNIILYSFLIIFIIIIII